MISTQFNRYNKEALLERRYFTGSMPLLTPHHSFKTCGGPVALSSTTTFMKCGGKLALGRGAERYILKSNLELPHQFVTAL